MQAGPFMASSFPITLGGMAVSAQGGLLHAFTALCAENVHALQSY